MTKTVIAALVAVLVFGPVGLSAQSQSPKAAGAGASEPDQGRSPLYRRGAAAYTGSYRQQPKPKKRKVVEISALYAMIFGDVDPAVLECRLWVCSPDVVRPRKPGR